MKIDGFAYRGNFLRPTPYILVDEALGVALITTPWGPKSTAEAASQSAIEFIRSSFDNAEVTSPFGLNTALSQIENIVKNAILTASNHIYRVANKEEITTGLEIMLLARRQHEMVVGVVGHSSLFLNKSDKTIRPLLLSSNCHQIAQDLIGIERNANILIRSWRVENSDEFIVLNSSKISSLALSKIETLGSDVNQLYRGLVSTKALDSFWLGKISL